MLPLKRLQIKEQKPLFSTHKNPFMEDKPATNKEEAGTQKVVLLYW